MTPRSPPASPRSMFDRPAVAAIDIRGGGPGTREGALLDLVNTVEGDRRHRAVRRLGVRARGRRRRAGLARRTGPRLRGPRRRDPDRARRDHASICSTAATRPGAASRPIAISATRRPLRPSTTSRSAASAPASAPPRRISRAGSARRRRRHQSGITVAALAVVNAVGSVTVGDGPWFWAAPFEIDGEFGGRGLPAAFTPDMLAMRIKGGADGNARAKTPRLRWSSPTPR